MWPLALLHYNAFGLVLLLLWTECPQSSSGTSPRHIKHFTCFMWHLVTPIFILNCGCAYISGEGLTLEPHKGTKPYFTCVCLILSWLHYVKRLGSVLPVGACVSWLIWSALQSAWKQGNVSPFSALQLVFDQFYSGHSLSWFVFSYKLLYIKSCNQIKYRIGY